MSVRRIISVEANDPLRTVRLLLRSIWDQVQLDGLFLPVWQDGDPPQSTLITSQDMIDNADPFIPVMHRNSTCLAVETMKRSPEKKFGFVMRPCELRTFRSLLRKLNIDPKRGLFISSDCLATFPSEDFDWRLEASDHREHMTQTALHFAAHGGILPSRYRNCCQFCDKPFPELADISIELLGIPTEKNLVINLQRPEIAEFLDLKNFNALNVPNEITQKRERTLMKLADWRQKAQAYTSAHLKEEHKTLSGLITHLTTCTYCMNIILEECPLFEPDWIQAEITPDTMVIESWLKSCGGCGMCEANCPENFPLFRSICFISHKLRARQ
jgi:NAD-dependent dihydropyrimidine dehydrogenase PreA subunit